MAVGINFDNTGRPAADRAKNRASLMKSEEVLMRSYFEYIDLHDAVRSQMPGRAEGGEDRVFYGWSKGLRQDVFRKYGAEIPSFSEKGVYMGKCPAKTAKIEF